MAQYVTFSGYTKKIIIKPGVEDLDVQIDLYSDWKEWVLEDDNSKWEAAFRTFGGDETSASQFAPRYFFLINGWKLYAEDVDVVIQTNLYSDDGEPPVDRVNAQILIRNSDVPVVQSEIEQRLDYGDRVYYDETSVYSGTTYPNGTIAQPVNNPNSAIAIANHYNINDIYALSNVTMPGVTGQIFDGWEIYADKPNLTFNPDSANTYLNMLFKGFTMIDTDLVGGENVIQDGIIYGVSNFEGEIKYSQMIGYLHMAGPTVVASCYSGIAGAGSPIFDMGENTGTTLGIRAYSGGVDLRNSNDITNKTTVELIAGQIKLNSSCTDGYIDLRGVGYITDESSGATINKTGFVDSFQTYIEETKELDEQLAYQNTLYYDPIYGFTGITYPVGTSAQPSNNIPQLYYLSEYVTNIKNIRVRQNFIASGITAILPPGQLMDYFTIIADAPGVNMYIYDDGIAENVNVIDFNIVYAKFGGLYNKFIDCRIYDVYDIAGTLSDCALYGNYGTGATVFRVSEDSVLINCYPGESVDAPRIWLTNTGGTDLSIRGWYGNVVLDKMEHDDDKISLDVGAGKIVITSGVTNGTIDLRGVGYLINNAGTGATIITTGFVDSFATYIEETRETDEILAYGDKIYVDIYSGSTGTTFPVGTLADPVNNLFDLSALATNLNVNNYYLFYDFISLDASGNTTGLPTSFTDYNLHPVKVDLIIQVNSREPGTITNSNLFDFIVQESNWKGDKGNFTNCKLINMYGLYTTTISSSLSNNISIAKDSIFNECYSSDGEPQIILESGNTNVSFRNYSGDISLCKMTHSGNTISIDMVAGKVSICSGITDGVVDLRGVGYLENHAGTGATIITTGFVDSFQSYIEETREIDQILAYNNELYYDPINGITGTSYPAGTSAQPSNNIEDTFILSVLLNIKNLRVREYLTLSGLTFSATTFNTYADTLNVPFYQYAGEQIYNSLAHGFDIVYGDFYGHEHEFEKCIFREIHNLGGQVLETAFDGNGVINILNSTTFINCFPLNSGDDPVINLVNTGGTKASFRGWTGSLTINTMLHSNDRVSMDIQAGHITITSACTNGHIDIRGVGYVEDNSGPNCIVQRDGQLQASPTEYNGQIVIDTVNGQPGVLFPVGTTSYPVDNLSDALILLETYQLSKIYIVGALTVSNGEDISGIAFTAERSTGNYLTISSAVTNFTYVENLTCINIVQNGSMRYTTSVLVNIENYDGGAKDCLIVDSNINIVGVGSNYFTNCDRYVTDPTAFTTFDVSDKKLNVIRCRGNFIIDNKTSSNTIAIDLTAGLMKVESGCTNGIIAINGITEVIDNSQSGCTVLIKAISNPSITDHVWDEQISEHLQIGSTGYKLNTASSGGVDYDALQQAVWSAQLSGYTGATTLAGDMLYTVNDTIIQITGLTTLNSDIERILGLVQQNYRVIDQIYDANNCLLSGTIKIYPTATDCDNDTNEIAEYAMSATYSATGQMLSYKVIEV